MRRQGLAQALERSRVFERPLGKEAGQGIGRGFFFSFVKHDKQGEGIDRGKQILQIVSLKRKCGCVL